MIAYVGLTRDKRMCAQLRAAGIGRIQQRGQLDIGALWSGERWAFDNGAFTDWTSGRDFNGEAYVRDVQRIASSGRVPTMAVAPDLVARGEESLAFSIDWRGRIACGEPWGFRVAWSWYLVLQDGIPRDAVARTLRHGWWTGLFLGGTDRFKAHEAADWCGFAHDNGLLFHYGRAGTPRKIEHARSIGADSLDSSFPLWTRDRMRDFLRLVGAYKPQQAIEWEVSA